MVALLLMKLLLRSQLGRQSVAENLLSYLGVHEYTMVVLIGLSD